MRILVLPHPGTVSRGLILDLMHGLESLGHDVLRFELEPLIGVRNALGANYPAAAAQYGQLVMQLIEDNDVDVSFGMWGNVTKSLPILRDEQGRIASLMEHRGHPHVHYWWDAPHWHNNCGEHADLATGLYRGIHQFHCINNAATGGEMASLMGFHNVLPQPNGVNPETFRPRPDIERTHDLAFISGPGDPAPTPVMLEELQRDDPDVERIRRDAAERLRPDLHAVADRFDADLRPLVVRLLDATLDARLGARHTPAIAHVKTALATDAALAPAASALLADLPAWCIASATMRRVDHWERPFMTAYLSRHFRCRLVGPAPDPAWPITADRTGAVDYNDQATVYAGAKCGLNVMRWQDDVGLNSKIFEITACGTPCLQSYRVGVDEAFAEDEIMAFRSPGEARDMLADALATPGRLDAIGAAGRARTLRDHTWASRMANVLGIIEQYWAKRGRAIRRPTPAQTITPAPKVTTPPAQTVSTDGDGLVFVLSPMRSGSTLLRKMLNAHPQVAAPPETWFLLPLLDLWQGEGTGAGFNAKQAAVALRTVTDEAGFVAACRAFASTVYSRCAAQGATVVVDKTPLYLRLADVLPTVFPRARFIVLARDPRATVWSFHTWDKVPSEGIESIAGMIGPQVAQQAAFARRHAARTLVVHYEALCEQPDVALPSVCAFLGVPYDARMKEYGRVSDARPGYGDEKSAAHGRPHVDSVRRWDFTPEESVLVAGAVGVESLEFFGFGELASMIRSMEPVGSGRSG